MYPAHFNGLFGLPRRVLTENERSKLIELLDQESGIAALPREPVEHEQRDTLDNYMKQYNIKAVPQAIDFILTLNEVDSPGKAILWCYTLRVISRQIPADKPVKLEDITLNFNSGVPHETAYHKAWELQKITPAKEGMSENWLDYEEAWITKIPESKSDEVVGENTTPEAKKA